MSLAKTAVEDLKLEAKLFTRIAKKKKIFLVLTVNQHKSFTK